MNISPKSNIVLTVLLVFMVTALWFVETNKVQVKQNYHNQKLQASILSKDAADYLKNFILNSGVVIDSVNDPNYTGLIGPKYTAITTDMGSIEAKLTTTNPNFAAAVVDMCKEAGLNKGDYVAVAYTGSFPALNISLLAALEVLEINPIIITSVGASNFGATQPSLTWLDMESYLYDKKIFSNKSIAASTGGGGDIGRGLSPEGRNLIKEAVARNNAEFIYEMDYDTSIIKRMDIYKKYSNGNNIKAYINVGGGIASLGSLVNSRLIPTGLSTGLNPNDYVSRGIIIEMLRREVPIIQLSNVNQLAKQYRLPFNPVPLPVPGEGELFYSERYDVALTSIIMVILSVLITIVYLIDKRRHRLGTEFIANSLPAPKVKQEAEVYL